jgi:hypothetical protein
MTQLAKQQNSVGTIKSLPNTTSKEISLYNAYQTHKKIKDFDTEDELKLISSLILRWANYVGIKKVENHELNTIANYIRKNSLNFNAYDIKECITLLVNGSLDTDAEHYGSLSIIYISKVMKSYQNYRGEIIFKVRDKLQKIEQEKVVVPTDAERIKNFKELLLFAKEKVTKKEVYDDFGDVLYYFFWKNNLVEKPMPESLINDAIAYGEEKFRTKAQNGALKSVINGVGFTKLVREDIVKKSAREYTINLWLRNADINAILKKISIEMIKY